MWSGGERGVGYLRGERSTIYFYLLFPPPLTKLATLSPLYSQNLERRSIDDNQLRREGHAQQRSRGRVLRGVGALLRLVGRGKGDLDARNGRANGGAAGGGFGGGGDGLGRVNH